jgi:mono/diheme cytochrome c family protein
MANNDRGRKLYIQYCASCHGIDATGTGPVAPNLCKPVPDLTQIEKREGKFPGTRIKLVTGGEVGQTEFSAHGTREMPVWGQVFRYKRGNHSTGMLDVYALTKYIESIQK